MEGYKLSRDWFNFSFDNPEKIKPIHSAIFFFACEHCNRLWGKVKFWFPTSMVMEAIGVKKWQTYNNGLLDLVEWGFIQLIEKSKNQYSSCIISLKSATPKKNEALDIALVKHGKKQGNITGQSTVKSMGQSTGGIDKQETINNKQGIEVATKVANPLQDLMLLKIDKQKIITEYNSTDEFIKKEMMDFYLYWSEKKPNWKKERWQMEKTFDINRRFNKWLQNSSKWNKQDTKNDLTYKTVTI